MGSLRNIRPQVASLRSRIAPARDVHGHSPKAEPWRAWYKLKRWLDLRLRVFVRDLFTCRWPGCGFMDATARGLVADHVEPHHGDPDLFWAEANVQTLCKPCHDRRKQAAERRARRA